MSKYDDASWHYGGDFPKELPEKNSATHTGMFLNWCIHKGLISDELREDSADEIEMRWEMPLRRIIIKIKRISEAVTVHLPMIM